MPRASTRLEWGAVGSRSFALPGVRAGRLPQTALLAHAFAGEIEAIGIVKDAIEDGIGEGWITEYAEMPHRLIVDSLASEWSIRIIRSTASAIRSATDARGEAPG